MTIIRTSAAATTAAYAIGSVAAAAPSPLGAFCCGRILRVPGGRSVPSVAGHDRVPGEQLRQAHLQLKRLLPRGQVLALEQCQWLRPPAPRPRARSAKRALTNSARRSTPGHPQRGSRMRAHVLGGKLVGPLSGNTYAVRHRGLGRNVLARLREGTRQKHCAPCAKALLGGDLTRPLELLQSQRGSSGRGVSLRRGSLACSHGLTQRTEREEHGEDGVARPALLELLSLGVRIGVEQIVPVELPAGLRRQVPEVHLHAQYRTAAPRSVPPLVSDPAALGGQRQGCSPRLLLKERRFYYYYSASAPGARWLLEVEAYEVGTDEHGIGLLRRLPHGACVDVAARGQRLPFPVVGSVLLILLILLLLLHVLDVIAVQITLDVPEPGQPHI
eukprot:scaffold290_cov364-Prasinococcus_capsulatus_cf.AAC.8